MKCIKCDNKSVIKLQHGNYCKNHFLRYFEEKVFETFRQYNLLENNDIVCVAASGGKDSMAVLYTTNQFCKKHNIKIFALLIDEGINGYREHTKQDLKKFCKDYKIDLKIVSFKDITGKTLDELSKIGIKKLNKKPCTICGILRRYYLNKYAKEYGATKLVTGHNLDDEAQAFMMNTLQGNMRQNASLGPISGITRTKKYAQRVKPLYFINEKESRLFCLLKNFKVNFAECPYIEHSYRAQIRDMLNKIEDSYPATKNGIIKSFLDIMPELKNKYKTVYENYSTCEICGEQSSGKICKACQLLEELDGKKIKACK